MTINLINTILLPLREKVLGIYAVKEGNIIERSRTDTFKDLAPPQICFDWIIITGLFAFDQKWLSWYE